MGTDGVRSNDMKLEVVVIPVSDVDRAKKFYGNLGWRLDADFPFDNGFRVVQFTPPGSGCSVQFGTKITSAAPGSAQGLYLIVSDIAAARDELVGLRCRGQRGVPRRGAGRSVPSPTVRSGRVGGPAPDHASYSSFATFSDPDGNGWLLQEVTTRLPGRVDSAATPSPRRAIWRARCGVRRPPMASTRSASAKPTRTGPTGTPSTWCASRPAKSCRNRRSARYFTAARPKSFRRLCSSGESIQSRKSWASALRSDLAMTTAH